MSAEDTDYRAEVIRRLAGYLDGTSSWKEVSDWALDVIVEAEVPPALDDDDVDEAISLLFDLHEAGIEPRPAAAGGMGAAHRDRPLLRGSGTRRVGGGRLGDIRRH
ncbi:MAG: hypothetical protein PVJ27_07445, partial [Candidatus Brocadiaceae bacterium]